MTTPTPEHDKLLAVAGESQAIGEFLEWLPGDGWTIEKRTEKTDISPCWRSLELADGTVGCRDGKEMFRHVQPLTSESTWMKTGRDCQICGGTGELHRVFTIVETPDITRLLAEYFDINLNAIEAEKRSILRSLKQS